MPSAKRRPFGPARGELNGGSTKTLPCPTFVAEVRAWARIYIRLLTRDVIIFPYPTLIWSMPVKRATATAVASRYIYIYICFTLLNTISFGRAADFLYRVACIVFETDSHKIATDTRCPLKDIWMGPLKMCPFVFLNDQATIQPIHLHFSPFHIKETY